MDPDGRYSVKQFWKELKSTAITLFNFDFGYDCDCYASQSWNDGNYFYGAIWTFDSIAEKVLDIVACYYLAELIGVIVEAAGVTVTTSSVSTGVNAIKHYGPMNKGPLPESIAKTFRGGSYSEVILQQETTFYRVYGGSADKIGMFWTKVKPTGIKVYEGFAEAQGGYLVGGGSQVVIPRIDPKWVVQE